MKLSSRLNLRHKVMAYVLRPCAGSGGHELLVFAHRDQPEAGVQVPAGTVEPGEAIEAAARRELAEESGLRPEQVRLMTKVAEADEAAPGEAQHRHVFAFEPASPLPDRWAHTVRGGGEDAGLVFECFWLPVTAGLKLAGGQERYLHLVGREAQR